MQGVGLGGQGAVVTDQVVAAQDRQDRLAHGGRPGAVVQLTVAGFLAEQPVQLRVAALQAACQRERTRGAHQQRSQAAGPDGGGVGADVADDLL
ncbi:hypothetical protein [Streptosporangium sp. LJ11]|uniref:hypothetical protein n=1 Tax=Streptosporangium sp. LJ11 TaxID=3436927 RepID=UPI003F7AE47A